MVYFSSHFLSGNLNIRILYKTMVMYGFLWLKSFLYTLYLADRSKVYEKEAPRRMVGLQTGNKVL
jgi:hypothetical protein